MTIGEMQQAYVAERRQFVKRRALASQHVPTIKRKATGSRDGQDLQEFATIHLRAVVRDARFVICGSCLVTCHSSLVAYHPSLVHRRFGIQQESHRVGDLLRREPTIVAEPRHHRTWIEGLYVEYLLVRSLHGVR